VKATILNHPEFTAFAARTMGRFHEWRDAHAPHLYSLAAGDEPKGLIRELAEDLLARFADADLVDPYAIYQLLRDYWAETMQDDVYLIVQDGWQAAGALRPLREEKGQKRKETPDLTVNRQKYKADLLPPPLLAARYFAAELAEIEQLAAAREAAGAELAALLEEHGGEEGLLAEAANERGSVTKASATARLKELAVDSGQLIVDSEEEAAALRDCLRLMEAESAAGRALAEAEKRLEGLIFARYGELSEAEIKALTVQDKWLATLAGAVQAEIERVTQTLTARVALLEERYSDPLPHLAAEVETLAAKVDAHLQKMGVL
jgi:type I restriction enzyme M protein